MRSPLALSLALLLGVSRGLYTTDDHTRDPARPLPLPPESPSPSPTEGSFGELHVDITRRQASSTAAIVSSTAASATSSATLPVAPTSIPDSPPAPAPTPMDLQLSYALSTPCLSYLSTLLSSSIFLSCLPFSLLTITSTGFADLLGTASDTGNYTTLNTLIAYVTSPQPSGSACDTFMSAAYTKMGESSSGCKADLAKRGAATEARTGLGNSAMMRKAAGLTNPDTGRYCYLEAVANEKPDDMYLWSLPANIALPPSTKPTCSKCSSLLLRHYSSSVATNPSLNATLVNAAVGTINGACGQDFAEYSVLPPASSGASPLTAQRGGVILSLVGAVLATVLAG